jgi:hypothetical protein
VLKVALHRLNSGSPYYDTAGYGISKLFSTFPAARLSDASHKIASTWVRRAPLL